MLVTIFGKRGAGKTQMIKGAIKNCEAPVVIIDILGNFDEMENSYQTESLSDALEKIRDYNDYERANDDERRFMEEIPRVIVLMPSDPDEAVNFISAMLWEEEGLSLIHI